ncbi:hypothetical protein MMJJ_05070 [Methanococcus maripaludis]|uniref:Phosphoglycerol transferase MdoB-like AlkP superfamily enzyme n=2 Tax=Methanococcus maripaludis TaxID=39152 RepID=A0A2L1C995_METMI|nr:hypothetical protein MMJJ_05070 [Methanococcus maripaludis]MBB6497867.1 phosphoglycerol transferase MdoB-like AlkP superfamily enzyme [Methanococcus maripaludis]
MPEYKIYPPSISIIQFLFINYIAFSICSGLWAILIFWHSIKFIIGHQTEDELFSILSVVMMLAILCCSVYYFKEYTEILNIFKEYDLEVKSNISFKRIVTKIFDKDAIIGFLSLIIILLSGIIFKLLF